MPTALGQIDATRSTRGCIQSSLGVLRGLLLTLATFLAGNRCFHGK